MKKDVMGEKGDVFGGKVEVNIMCLVLLFFFSSFFFTFYDAFHCIWKAVCFSLITLKYIEFSTCIQGEVQNILWKGDVLAGSEFVINVWDGHILVIIKTSNCQMTSSLIASLFLNWNFMKTVFDTI